MKIFFNRLGAVPMVTMAQSTSNWHNTHSRGSHTFTHALTSTQLQLRDKKNMYFIEYTSEAYICKTSHRTVTNSVKYYICEQQQQQQQQQKSTLAFQLFLLPHVVRLFRPDGFRGLAWLAAAVEVLCNDAELVLLVRRQARDVVERKPNGGDKIHVIGIW